MFLNFKFNQRDNLLIFYVRRPLLSYTGSIMQVQHGTGSGVRGNDRREKLFILVEYITVHDLPRQNSGLSEKKTDRCEI